MDVISFFAGCGGLDLGFEQAGFRVVWANESEPSVYDTYVKNHINTKLVLGDICSIKTEEIPYCDGFIGGPPCQSWSVAGKQKGLEDARGLLFQTYIDLIKRKRPKFFLIENVKGLLGEVFKNNFTIFLNELSETGYQVKWSLLDAANFGVPQNRERVFIVGFRNDLHVDYEFPKACVQKPISLMQAIGDIKEPPAAYTSQQKLKPNPIRANHDVLETAFTPFYHRGNRRRGWHQPSFTIHATAENMPLHPSSPKMMFYGHENWDFQKDKMNEYRRLSVRECARIQTFPDNFIFEGTDIKTQYKMIGNAVPPRLSRALAMSISAAFISVNSAHSDLQDIGESEECTLVGYFKDQYQHDCIIKNKLYYIRSDGRPGSIFKEDCEITPRFLLLHHKHHAELYELEWEEPVLADCNYLRKLGFNCNGKTYLLFRIKNEKPIETDKLKFDAHSYNPYFAMLGDVVSKRNKNQ